jgi:hypothetical protein
MKIPKEIHYAIISERQIYIPGDQRSRDAPGHGYPEHYETVIDYEVFSSKLALETAIRSRNLASAVIAEVRPLKLKVELSIE